MNQHPEVAEFLRQPGHAQRYEKVAIEWIDHHNPDLVLFDAHSAELQRIDLTRFSTTDSLHRMMRLFGFEEKCSDDNDECARWAGMGECTRNPPFMHATCRKACDVCSKRESRASASRGAASCRDAAAPRDCEFWSTLGDCEDNPRFMRENCAHSCGVCTPEARGKDEL